LFVFLRDFLIKRMENSSELILIELQGALVSLLAIIIYLILGSRSIICSFFM
jgi:hypothetical protein